MSQGSQAPQQFQPPQQRNTIARPFSTMGHQGGNYDTYGQNNTDGMGSVGYTPQIPGVNQPTGTVGTGQIAGGTLGVVTGVQGNQHTNGAPNNYSAGASVLPYVQAAGAMGQQSQANTGAQTQANRPNQSTPYGSSYWSIDPTTGRWTQRVGFNGPMQGMFNSLEGQWAQGPGAFQTAAYNQAKSRLDPQFQQGQEQLDTQIANMGGDPGSLAARNAQDQFARNKNDAYQTAYNNSFQQGLAAQQANFSQLAGMRDFLNMPGFNAAGMAQTPNYLGAIMAGNDYDLALQGYNNANAADQASAAMGIFNTAQGFMPYATGYGGGQSYSI